MLPKIVENIISYAFALSILPNSRDHVSVGAINAAAPTEILQPVNIYELHCKLMEFDFLHPHLSFSYAAPETERVQ